MRDDIVAIAAYAKQMGVPVAIAPSVTPRLTASTLQALREQGVKTASLSLDGATADTHDRDVALTGISKPHCGPSASCKAMVLPSRSTPRSWTKHRRAGRHRRADAHVARRHMGSVLPDHYGPRHRHRPSTARENEDICHFLVDASQYGFTVRTVEAPFFRRVALERTQSDGLSLKGTFDTGPLYLQLRDRLNERLGPPTAPVRRPSAATHDGKGIIFVSASGDVYPSGFMPLLLGNVREGSLVQVYRDHQLLRAIRDARFAGQCGTCEHADLCGGSRPRAYAASGDPLGEDPGCIRTLAARHYRVSSPPGMNRQPVRPRRDVGPAEPVAPSDLRPGTGKYSRRIAVETWGGAGWSIRTPLSP